MNTALHTTTPSAVAGLPPSNSGSTATLDLLAARSARDGLRTLLGAEHSAAASFLVALAAFDARRGWEPLGHASLYDFLRSEFRLSRSGAFWRQSAARLLQRFPEVIEALRDGRLCATTAAEVAKVLTRENLPDVLPRYFGLSSREAAEVTASLQPREEPPLRMVVTDLPRGRSAPATMQPRALAAEVGTRAQGPVQALGLKTAPAHAPTPAPIPRTDVEPLTANLRRLHVTVSARLLKKIDAARDGLSHALPNATTEQVLEAALDLLLEKQSRARGLVKRPRARLAVTGPVQASVSVRGEAADSVGPATEPPPSHHRRTGPRVAIPAAVRRAVWERDGGRCCWPLDGGGTCGSTRWLELDHIVPWAKGGEATADNLRVVCRAHNALAATRSFGGRVTERYARSECAAAPDAPPLDRGDNPGPSRTVVVDSPPPCAASCR